jgi:hypothetical protein
MTSTHSNPYISKNWRAPPKSLDQKVVEHAVQYLTLDNCPVCITQLEDTKLPNTPTQLHGYCQQCDNIIELNVHNWNKSSWGGGYDLSMKIHTNDTPSELVAESGILTHHQAKHATLGNKISSPGRISDL